MNGEGKSETSNALGMKAPVKKRGLGRGLSSLISSSAVPVNPSEESSDTHPRQPTNKTPYPPLSVLKTHGGDAHGSAENKSPSDYEKQRDHDGQGAQGVRYLPLSMIKNNPQQPRQEFDEQEIEELANSIKEFGVLQPVLVRPIKSSSKEEYEIVAGERRWRAAQKSGLAQLPVIIRSFSEKEALEISIIENVQRSNLSILEEAEAYQRLIEEFSLSQREVADRVSKDRTSVANIIRLLKLPREVQDFLRNGKISAGHAKAILTVKEPSAQMGLARKVIEEGLSVRQLEGIVARQVVLGSSKKAKNKQAKQENDGAYQEASERLRRALGTKVLIKNSSSGRGKIEIEYYSAPELDRLLEKLAT